MAHILELETHEKKGCLDITLAVSALVRDAGLQRGLCHVMVMGATAAVVVNENDDPNIGVDLLTALDRMIPDHAGWLHDQVDNNAQAHIKAAILGPSETVPVEDGDLLLGTWQGLMLVELDGPRKVRRLAVQLMPLPERR